jgi:hypothetical protein
MHRQVALYLCFVFISEQTATCATNIINQLVFITEIKSVYCAVRTRSLKKAVCTSCYGLILMYIVLLDRVFVINVTLFLQPLGAASSGQPVYYLQQLR